MTIVARVMSTATATLLLKILRSQLEPTAMGRNDMSNRTPLRVDRAEDD